MNLNSKDALLLEGLKYSKFVQRNPIQSENEQISAFIFIFLFYQGSKTRSPFLVFKFLGYCLY